MRERRGDWRDVQQAKRESLEANLGAPGCLEGAPLYALGPEGPVLAAVLFDHIVVVLMVHLGESVGVINIGNGVVIGIAIIFIIDTSSSIIAVIIKIRSSRGNLPRRGRRERPLCHRHR